MKKGDKKENVLECTINLRVTKEEKVMLDYLRNEKYFNVSKFIRDMIRETYEKNK